MAILCLKRKLLNINLLYIELLYKSIAIFAILLFPPPNISTFACVTLLKYHVTFYNVNFLNLINP